MRITDVAKAKADAEACGEKRAAAVDGARMVAVAKRDRVRKLVASDVLDARARLHRRYQTRVLPYWRSNDWPWFPGFADKNLVLQKAWK